MDVSCPGCGKRFNVPDTAAGKKGRCPACRREIAIPMSLFIQPLGGGPRSPHMPKSFVPPPGTGGSCHNCGYPHPPGTPVCTRCGTDLATGFQSEELAGYKARWPNLRVGGLITLGIVAVVGFGGYFVFTAVRGWTRSIAEKREQEAEKRREPPPPKKRAVKKKSPAVAKAPEQPSPVQERPKPKRDPEARFKEVVALLTDPLPASRQDGFRKLRKLGKAAAPYILKALETEKSPAARATLIGALSRIRAEEGIAAIVKALADPDAGVSSAAEKALLPFRKSATAALGEALASDDPALRVRAARMVRRMNLKELAERIAKLLDDDDKAVRLAAAQALGAVGSGKEAARALLARLDDPNMDVADVASKTLARLQVGAELLLEAISAGAAGAKSKERESARIFWLVRPVLSSGSQEARSKLVDSVCRLQPLRAVRMLARESLGEGNSYMRRQALGRLVTREKIDSRLAEVAAFSLGDPDERVRWAALDVLRATAPLGAPLPLVVALGWGPTDFAFQAVELLSRPAQAEKASGLLKRASKGLVQQRKVLAAGVLARGGQRSVRDILEEACKSTELPPPLAGWAAYHLSFLKPERLRELTDFLLDAAKDDKRRGAEKAYYAGAAARLGSGEAGAILRRLLTGRGSGGPSGEVKATAAFLLGDLAPSAGDKDAVVVLAAALQEPSAPVQSAAASALVKIGLSEGIKALLERIPDLTPKASEIAVTSVQGLGGEAEVPLREALASRDGRVQTVCLSMLPRLGRLSKATMAAVILLLKDPSTRATVRDRARRTLEKLTGQKAASDREWRYWARVCMVQIDEKPAKLELSRLDWQWVSMEVPTTWSHDAMGCGDRGALGSPRIDCVLGREPAKMKFRRSTAERRIKSDSIAEMEGIRAKKAVRQVRAVEFRVNRVTAAPLRVMDDRIGRTTYYVFLAVKGKEVNRYAEIAMSASNDTYNEHYRELFERTIARSLKLDLSREEK